MADDLIAQNARLVNLLWGRGYFPAYSSGAEALSLLDMPTFQQALKEYESLTGQAATEEAAETYFCLQPDRAPVRATMCQWKHTPVTWHTEGGLKGVSPGDFQEVAGMAFDAWMAVCGVVFKYNPNPKTCNLWLHAANLGGPGGVLGDQQLPCGAGPNARLEGRYDGESWRLPGSNTGQIPLRTTLIHEMGHGGGLDHGPQGCIMAPTLSSLSELQAWDIAEAQKRYGLPRPADVPPTPGAARIRCSFEWDENGKLVSGVATGARITILGG